MCVCVCVCVSMFSCVVQRIEEAGVLGLAGVSHASVMPFGKNFKISANGLSELLDEELNRS